MQNNEFKHGTKPFDKFGSTSLVVFRFCPCFSVSQRGFGPANVISYMVQIAPEKHPKEMSLSLLEMGHSKRFSSDAVGFGFGKFKH